jgi:nucleotide-binding universal stress UspA family protein
MLAHALRSLAPQVRPLSVLCGVESAVAALDAARQAVEIAARGRVAFVSVATPANRPMDDMCLDAAVLLARRDRGVRDVHRLAGAAGVAHALALAARHDLLVVGASAPAGESSALVRVAVRRAARRTDATMIAIGGPMTPRWRNAADLAVALAERAPCSVLVARGRE